MTAMGYVQIRLFGTFEVQRGGESFTPRDWHSQQARTILKVLLARRGRAVPSDQLLEILWPGEDPHTTRRRLHVRVSQLRRALDPEDPSAFVLTVEGGYSFAATCDCWVDVAAFEALAGEGRQKQEEGDLAGAVAVYEAARDLYRGDFLEEDLYADWAFAERERLRERFLTLLVELAECYAQQGRYRRAIAHCHQLLARDPCREAAYVRLMLYHYYAGEQGQSLQVYARCREVLGAELDVEPLPATRALAERIRDGSLGMEEDGLRYPPPAYQGRLFEVPYSLGRPAFIGRDREYAWLIEKSRDKRVRVLFVGGEAGVGKSRLVDEFAGYAASQGRQILRARLALTETLPLAAVIQALRPHLAPDKIEGLEPEMLARLALLFPEVRGFFPALPPAGRATFRDEAGLFQAVEALVHALLPGGAILVVDDAHRAGEASCRLLARLAETLTLVLVYRMEETSADHPLHSEFRRLRREGKAADLQLERISFEASRELIHALGDGVPAGLAEQVAERTGGSPLFLVALLQNLFEEGLLHIDPGGRWAATEEIVIPLPGTVRETLEARLSHLSRDQRRIFDLASVLGGEFGFDVLRQASGEPEDPLLDILDSLMDAGLVVEPRMTGREEFAVSHDFYVEVAYGTLPAVRRRRLHRAAAEALLALKGDEPGASAELAYHFHRAGKLARAAHFAQLAGEHALHLYAGQRAVAHIEDALRWREEAGLAADEAREARLHFSLGDALRLAGRYDQALGHFARALPAAEGKTKVAAAFHVVTLAAMQGQGTGLAQFAEMAPALERELSSMGQTWALTGFRWMQGYLLTIQGDRLRSRQCTAEGWRLARQLLHQAEPAPAGLQAWAYLVLARAHERWSDWRQALHYADKSLARYAGQKDLYGTAANHVTRAAAHYGLGEWQAALDACQQCIELATEADDPRWTGEALYFAGLVHLEQGEHALAECNARQVLETAQSTGDLLRGGLAQILLARLAVQRYQPEEAIPLLEAPIQAARAASAESYAVLALRHLAEAHLLAGDLATATATAQEGLVLAQRSGMKRERCGCLQVLGVASAQAGDLQAGERQLLDAARLAKRIGCRYELALTRHRLEELTRA